MSILRDTNRGHACVEKGERNRNTERITWQKRAGQISEVIHVPNFFLEVAKERLGTESLSSDAEDEFFRRILSSPLMNLFPKPLSEGEQISVGNLLGKLRKHLQGLVIEHRGIQVAQGVGRKIPNGAKRPMHILKHALGITVGSNANILLHFRSPEFG